jgi:OOP family OmpA-OmpF porin
VVTLPSFRPTQTLLSWAAFLGAAALFLLISWGASLIVERISAAQVRSHLLNEGMTWVEIRADGLQIQLYGTAPNEAQRFRAVNLTGGLIDNSRIRDRMEVTPAKAFEAPRFSLEMLRNDDGIQLIGLLPAGEARDSLIEIATALQPDIPLQDMIETADYPAPAAWQGALDFGVTALKLLPRSKISVSADLVSITAIAASDAERRNFENRLSAARPQDLPVKIEVSAPRPVITPFTLRFVKDGEGARFDACAADTEKARDRIIAAATAAGATGRINCTVGLGVPSPSWAEAAAAGIHAVADLEQATVTFSDADVTLEAAASVAQSDFDRVAGELEAALPDVFSLDARLEKAASTRQGPAEFTAMLNGETGRIELRGRLTDEPQRAAVNSYATALFGTGKVYLATRMDPELPDGWPVRVLAGLEALSQLKEGRLVVRADLVQITGRTGSQFAKGRISQVLSDKLGQGQSFKVDVRYEEALDPIASVPTPQECAEDAAQVLRTGKIVFPPGSAEIEASANGVLQALADVLKRCPGVKMEIQGHTDSQGSDSGNLALSQARAEAVLLALQGRQVDVSAMTARGYGETRPIAENQTELGREFNRRIEFVLVGAETPAAPEMQDATTPAEGSDAAAAPAQAAEGPDFSGDDSPSVAPAEKTIRPRPRPEKNG